ncbi:hypothetical protein BKA67DRAFT_540406 [Truncatella angustata]|uniref:Rhodopsin domain-containing protein n=1 Tax=Truncatella angustata TaxID=152316 RepID=A0A9P8RJ16_9PEZI|nr:uncharacterized protein BKA67DRAFT_540406 [Truncatella angustata]KAH6646938.1 hypothetical protein BKA67DRAFT_540406 [Truncatella angustata]
MLRQGFRAAASPSALTGQALIDLAWIQEPIEVKGLSLALTIITIGLLVLSATAVGLRVYVRAWLLRKDRIWGLDDTFAVLSFLVFIPSCVYVILAANYGLGTPDAELTDPTKARAALYMGYWQMHYAVSVNLVKAGIAIALLRLTIQRRYRYPLWMILTAPPLFTFGVIVVLVSTCRPVGAQWDLNLGTCSTHVVMAQLSYLFTVFTVILDWACAIIPYLLLKDLPMKRHVKISLIVVLTMGGFASCAAIVRIPYLKYYLITEDQLYYFAHIVLWSTIENGIGIIAASLPPIRKLFSFYRDTHRESDPVERGGAVETIGGTPLTQASVTRLRALGPRPSGYTKSGSRQWSQLDSDSSSREQIVHPQRN